MRSVTESSGDAAVLRLHSDINWWQWYLELVRSEHAKAEGDVGLPIRDRHASEADAIREIRRRSLELYAQLVATHVSQLARQLYELLKTREDALSAERAQASAAEMQSANYTTEVRGARRITKQ